MPRFVFYREYTPLHSIYYANHFFPCLSQPLVQPELNPAAFYLRYTQLQTGRLGETMPLLAAPRHTCAVRFVVPDSMITNDFRLYGV